MSELGQVLERAQKLAPPPAEDPFARLVRRRASKARRSRVAAIVVAALVAVGGIGGAVAALSGRRGIRVAHPVGGPSIDLTIGPGQYYYERTVPYTGDPLTEAYASESWWATDDSGRARLTGGKDDSFTAGQFPNDTGDLTYLSLDPAVLEQQLRDRVAPGGASPEPYEEFTPGPGQEGHVTAGLVRSIGELLHDPNAIPALKAALFQVAEGLQGMQVVPGTTDPVGRPAVELRIETEQAVHQWWFDPASQQLLATQDSDAGTGQSWGIEIIQEAGIAESTGDNPDLAVSFVPPTSQVPSPG